MVALVGVVKGEEGTGEGNERNGGTSEGTEGDGGVGGDYVSQLDPSMHVMSMRRWKLLCHTRYKSWI